MKNLLFPLLLLPLLLLTVSACHNEPAPQLKWLENDSIALRFVSLSFGTEAENYPHPWSVEDRSTWEGNVKLDKVIDPETGETALAVSALTLYIYKPNNPMDRSLLHLKHVKDFKVYACPGAIFNPEYIPIGCDSVLVDKIDPNVPGRIRVPKGRWYTLPIISQYNWFFSKLIVHWLDANEITYWPKDDAIVDLSNNELDVVLVNYLQNRCGPNLSHNKFTADKYCWQMMFQWLKIDEPFPNLQYNNIEIPDSVIGTEFWEKYHENFIGNPGYVAP